MSQFDAAAYITGLKETSSTREALEAKAADAATNELSALNVTFDEALAADAARVNDEEFDANHAWGYDAALQAATVAVGADLKGTGAFVSLGWR